MKKSYGFYSVFITLVFLILTESAGAIFNGDGKGVYEQNRQAGIQAIDSQVNAPTSLSDLEAVPEGLTKPEWGKIRASIERDRYRLHKDDRTGRYLASNHAHSLEATFTREGFEVNPRKGNKAWIWGLRLARYGYGSELRDVSGAEKVVAKDNRIEYHRGDMVEWYINYHRGLEQGFTLNARPAGRRDSESLQLHMKTTGNLTPVVEKEGKGIVWRDARAKIVLRYSGLYAYDATGKELDSRMTADKEGIRLIVADHEAVYPVTIDPFIESKKLLSGDVGDNDYFGYSVSISGDTVIVGACADDYNGIYTGSAYIFSRNHGGMDNWEQVKKLTASDGAAYDFFGYSVSISGDTVIVGVVFDEGNATDSGSAYIFSRNRGGAGNWGQVKRLIASDGTLGASFGNSVSISGDTVIVGAHVAEGNGVWPGAAYIFSRNHGGTDNWGEVQKLLSSDGAEADQDWFGHSVSISGDTAIVGAPHDEDNEIYRSGSAYIFSRDQGGLNNWGQVQKLNTSEGVDGDGFGRSVSISRDTAIVAAHYSYSDFDFPGRAYIFSNDQGGLDNWGLVKKLTASDAEFNDQFGYSLSISGDMAIVAAWWDDDNGDKSGSAYIFSRDQGGADNWGEVEKLTASDGPTRNFFGGSVSISGDTVIVGAELDQLFTAPLNSGSAYIFSVPAFGDELSVDFSSNGLWHYDGSWSKLSNWNPDDDLAGWSNGLAVDFGTGRGLWNNDGASWRKISNWNVDSAGLTGWSNGLAVDFGDNGLWNNDGASWSRMSNWDPDDDLTGWSNGLAVDFGASGLWNNDGASWSKLSNWNVDSAGLTGWSNGLAVDFGGNGLWNRVGSAWSRMSNWDPEDDLAGWPGGLAVDFDGNGLWNNNGSSWTRLSNWNPEGMTGVADGLVVDFGANGVWKYDGSSWSRLSNWNAENMADCDLN